MAINDFFANNSSDERQDEITKSYSSAKKYFSENIPYTLQPSPVSRTAKIVVFSQHFIDLFRLMLSNPLSGCIVQMSERERDIWYSFNDYQNGEEILDPDILLVVTELNNCIINEIECKTETYLDMCFSEEFTWDTNPVKTDVSSVTEMLTQAQYDIKTADGEIVSSYTYLITLNSVTVKIYIGEIIIWEI